MTKKLIVVCAILCAALGARAEIGWTTGSYDRTKWASSYNVLKGISATYTGSWYKPSQTLADDTAVLTDGSVPTASAPYLGICGISNGMTMTWEIPEATDIKSFRVFTCWGDGGRSGIGIDKVEYQAEGNDDWTEIPNSSLTYGFGNNNKPSSNYGFLADSEGALIAEAVRKLRVTFGDQDNNGGGYVEFEAEGETTCEWSAGDYDPASWTPSANNLLAGRTAEFSGVWHYESAKPTSTDSATLTDGSVPGSSCTYAQICAIEDNSSLTWDLGTASDVKELRIFSRWGDGGRSGIGISSVEVMRDGESFWRRIPAVGVSYQVGESAGASLTCRLANTGGGNIAENVIKLRVNLGHQDNGASGYVEFEAISGTEMKPTPPIVEAYPCELGNRSQTFCAVVSDYGRYSGSAVLTMELSESTDFSGSVIASDPLELSGDEDLNVVKRMTVAGLLPDTAYYSRLKVVNEAGIVVITDARPYSTRSPLVIRHIGYSQNDGGLDVEVYVECIDGVSATVELFANGASAGSQAITEAGRVPFRIASAAGVTELRAVLSGGGDSAEKTVAVPTGSVGLLIDEPSEHASSATAVKLRVGDRIMLPPLMAEAAYKVLNTSFLLGDGSVLTAVRPGVVGVECYAPNGALVTTMAVIVMPERIGDGNVYIWKEDTAIQNDWCTAERWTNADGTPATDFPRNADDIAVIPFYAVGGKSARITQDITLGGLYYGRFVSGKDAIIFRLVGDNDAVPTISFERGDGNPVIIQICGNSAVENIRTFLYFSNGSARADFRYVSDTVLDGGWDGVDCRFAGGRPAYVDESVHEVMSGATLSWRNIDATGTAADNTFIAPLLTGGGTVWNRSAANIRYTRQSDGFTGIVRDSSHGNENITRSGPTFFFTAAMTNAAAEVYGFVANDSGVPTATTDGVGLMWIGADPSWSTGPKNYPWISWLPKQGMTLVNGVFACGSTEDPTYGPGNAEYKHTEKLGVGAGFSYFFRQEKTQSNRNKHPINWFETDSVVHADKGTLRVDDRHRGSVANPETASETNNVTVLHGVADHLVGGEGDPRSSDNYPIVPWMVAPSYNTNNKGLAFACFDGDDRLCDMAARTNRDLDEVEDADENAYVNGQSVALTANRTVNSLWINNATQEGEAKRLGGGNALTVTSGGVILNGEGTGIGTSDGGESNGTLVLGDATHPGYVFAESTSASAPNVICAKVTAPGGLVFGYTGYAQLAGDQTGIDGELVVNAGTLALGDGWSSCTLDVPIRILANATVKADNLQTRRADVYFDDIAGATGRIELPVGETSCRRMYMRDTPEETEWVLQPSGTYGATGSGADFIDDAHFTGPGVLKVSLDRRKGICILFK